jgi:hypothetical protein
MYSTYVVGKDEIANTIVALAALPLLLHSTGLAVRAQGPRGAMLQQGAAVVVAIAEDKKVTFGDERSGQDQVGGGARQVGRSRPTHGEPDSWTIDNGPVDRWQIADDIG